MLRWIEENVVLVLCTLLAIISGVTMISNEKNLKLVRMASGELPENGKFVADSVKQLWQRPKGAFHRILLVCLVFLFACIYFIGLHSTRLPDWAAIFLFLPLTVLSAVLVEVFLCAVSFLLRKLLRMERVQFNLLYSFVLMQLFFIGIFAVFSGEHLTDDLVFWLSVCNLLFCYFMAAKGLYLLLKEASDPITTLTLRSVWKAAFLQIILFLLVLTFLSYFGFVHNPTSYQTVDGQYSFWTAFYYITVTFGTVGYGDIIPLTGYTRFVAVLTVFTSILAITVMLSVVLSLSGRLRKQKHTKKSSEEVLNKNFQPDSNEHESAH